MTTRAAPYPIQEYRPASLSLETPFYKPVMPGRVAPLAGMSYEKPYIDLEMTIQSLLSDGSGGAASDCQLEGGKREAGVSRKDDQEDDEMGDNY